MIEVGLGGDMTAAAEAEEWAEAYKEGKKMTTSCCPAFVNMIKQHFPQLLDNMSTTVSPMCADLPYAEGAGSGGCHCLYRTVHREEERDAGSEYQGQCGLCA